MKKSVVSICVILASFALSLPVSAQYRDEAQKSDVEAILNEAGSAEEPVVITLEQALEIALSENISVKVADMEIERSEYAKKGSYAALWPQIDASGAYQ